MIMKLNKLFFGLLGIATLFTACKENEDDDYKWASVSGEQSYFSFDLPTKVELDTAATSFKIPVKRINSSGALTVPLTCIDTLGVFTFPSSVTFEAGSAESVIEVGYEGKNRQKFPYDDFKAVEITLNDANYTTPYGMSTYKFTAGVPAPLRYLGTGTWEDNYMFEETVDVEIYQNEINPNLFRIMLNYADVLDQAGGETNGNESAYTEITLLQPGDEFQGENLRKGTLGPKVTIAKNNLVYWTPIDFGYANSTGEMIAMHPYCFGWSDPEDFETSYVDQYQDNGLPGRIYISGLILVDIAGGRGWAPCNSGDPIATIIFPDYTPADYTAEMAYAGTFTDLNNDVFAVANTVFGEDATNVKAVVVSADADPDAVADAIAAGELEGTDVSGDMIYVPIGEDQTGALQIVLVVFDANGKVKNVLSAPFEYYGGGVNPWQSLGIGLYTDDFVVPLYTEAGQPYTYEVEVLESSENPGLYRIVKAYKPVAEAFGVGGGEETIEVNAVDPEGVYIDAQLIGMNLGNGDIAIQSWGARYLGNYTVDELKAEGYLGTLKDGIITLPTFERTGSDGNTYYYQGLTYLGSSGYYAGSNGAFKLILPEAYTPEAKKKYAAQKKALEFERRLNAGMRIKVKNIRIQHFKTAEKYIVR